MDKYCEYRRYYGLNQRLPFEGNFLSQKKVLMTRIFKLSVGKGEQLSTEIGRISFESGQLQKSLLQLKRTLIMHPDSPYAQVYLARALLQLEKENDAFCELQKALCLDPTYSHAHETVIKGFLEKERLEGVDSFYQEIANMFADTKYVANLYYGSAEALVASNNYAKALEMYKKAFENHQLNSTYHFEYARALYHEGLFEEALVQLEHVKRLDPTNNIAFNNEAYLQYCLGRLQKSFEGFEYIIENGLKSTSTYSSFILVLHHMDKDEEVINRYRDLLQQNLGENGLVLKAMYKEALRITQAILERDDIDEETREFNNKKIQGINLVLSFLN